MKVFIAALLFFFITSASYAQEYFTIKQYDVAVKVNEDASLDITETIYVHFTEPRHGIKRQIPFRYKLERLAEGVTKANRQMERNGYTNTIIENIQVDKRNYTVNTEGDFKTVQIGDQNILINGDQQYVIHYTVKNAINFFDDHSEFNLNLIGDRWLTTIDQVNFSVELYKSLPSNPEYFVATGLKGSKENSTITKLTGKKILSGVTTRQLQSTEDLTAGLILPKDFFKQTKYSDQNFSARKYDVINKCVIQARINKDASVDITETVYIHFDKPMSTFRRWLYYGDQFRYPFQELLKGEVGQKMTEEFFRPYQPAVENITVHNQDYVVSNMGGTKFIEIKFKKGALVGNQQLVITYKITNAIDFFKNRSEFYLNFNNNNDNGKIDTVNLSIELYEALPDQPLSFVRTSISGFMQNDFSGKWINNKSFFGATTENFEPNDYLIAGITFPKGFINQSGSKFTLEPQAEAKSNSKFTFNSQGISWLIIPAIVFIIMFIIWLKWGKDDKVTIQTEFYPPDNISPSVAGYLIDNRLNRRDLTALIPYWGAGGYLKVREKLNFPGASEKDYHFSKLKDLPENTLQFEKTFFNGLFNSSVTVALSDLKNSLYSTMDSAKSQLEAEINSQEYYVKNSRKIGTTIIWAIIALIAYVGGFIIIGLIAEGTIWQAAAVIFSLIILVLFALLMPKKTKKGNEAYSKLAGFKEFIKLVEKDKLNELLKEDENYFDKVLPYAIVYGIADRWKDKLEGLAIRPPDWYKGNFSTFTTAAFLTTLHHSMNEMSTTFYSSPPSRSTSSSSSSSGSSGGSWRSSGGSSGGGFGGGGGSSW